MVKRSISAAAKGDTKPNSRIFIETASDICDRLHPNAISKGMKSTDGADRNPAVTTSVRKVTPAAVQPGWSWRDLRSGFVVGIEMKLYFVALLAIECLYGTS